MAALNPKFDPNQNGEYEEQMDYEDEEEFADGTTTVISSLSSNTTPSWVPPPPTPLQQQQEEGDESTQSTPPPPPENPGMTSATTPAFGMKAVYSRNEAAAEAGAAAAARQEEGLSIAHSDNAPPPLVPLARNPSAGGSAAPGTRRNSEDDRSPAPPPLLQRMSTPGAVSVPGMNGSVDGDEHDNLLEQHGDDEMVDTGEGTRNVATSTPPPEPRHQLSSPTSLAAMSSDSSPIVAELASSAFSYDTQDVEDRLAERLEAQMNERLREEVDRRLSQERRSHAIAEVVKQDDKSSVMEQHPSAASSGPSVTATMASHIHEDENFKICGIRRTCWGMILCTILLFIIGGIVGTVLWFARDNEKDDGPQPTAAPLQPPVASIVPTATVAPSSTPTVPLVDQRWDYLVTELGPNVVPPGVDPIEYFSDEATPQYAALNWMATDDLATDVFETPDIALMERYVLANLYFATDGPQKWTDSLNFLGSGNFCEWNDGDKGAFCTGGPLVTSIILPENGLQGRLPWELSLLEYLLEIQFDFNNLYGSIPSELGKLSNVQSMWFSSNSLSGALPSELASATSLESIDFENNTITSSLPMEWGSSLSDLFYIGLRLNNITGTLPVDWSRLSNLRVLDLEENQLDGDLPTEYGLLTQLSSLYLESNIFEGPLPSEYGDLIALRNFFVYGNRLSGTVPTQYTELSNLESFWFHDNNLTGDINDIFCVTDPIVNLRADCSTDDNGFPAPINCTCCTCV